MRAPIATFRTKASELGVGEGAAMFKPEVLGVWGRRCLMTESQCAALGQVGKVGVELPFDQQLWRKASPNTRVQRTRPSASPPHSPLMRRPLGGTKVQYLTVALLVASLALAGCSLALPAYNEPFQERIHVITASPEALSIQIDGSSQQPISVPISGLTVLDVPVLPRECSTYVFGLRIKDRSVKARPIIQFVRNGQVVKALSINAIRRKPADASGYREVRIG